MEVINTVVPKAVGVLFEDIKLFLFLKNEYVKNQFKYLIVNKTTRR